MTETYTYTIARIRALEAKMLSPLHVSRMIESPDLDRAFFVLNETTYADHVSAGIHPFDFEVIVMAEQTRVHNFLRYYAGDNESLLKFWRRYDYGNAKILLRALKLKLEEPEVPLSDFGVVNKELISSYILKGSGTIPVWLEKVIGEALLAFEEEKSPAEIDRVLDEVYLKDLRESGSDFLKKLSVLWRAGQHPFDLEGDNKTVDLLRGVKRKSFGIEPLITFWLAKELEIKTIRQILVGKKHRIGLNLIKDRIRNTYV